MQKEEANKEFFKYVSKTIPNGSKNGPRTSQNLLRDKVFPLFANGKPTIMILMDNLRFDQWKIIELVITELYRIEEEDFFYSILPTATQYSRNSIFAGLMPLDIQKKFPDWWLNDNEEGGKNMKESDLLTEQIKRLVKRTLNQIMSKSLMYRVQDKIRTMP